MSAEVPAASVIPDANPWWKQWDPDTVYLMDETVEDSWKTCVLQGVYFGESSYNGSLGGRISSVFVILITTLIVTLFPVLAKRIKRLRIPKVVYTVSKNFGTGVILTTAFIHLMDPAYGEIGGSSCVGQTGTWAIYSWCPAIMLATATLTFLIDTYADFFADKIYNSHGHSHNVDQLILNTNAAAHEHNTGHTHTHGDEESFPAEGCSEDIKKSEVYERSETSSVSEANEFYSQIGGFMILEFGVIFHSVMIGLTLGTSDEYSTLYIVLVFHQAFEGLGIGARLSMIPFPQGKRWWPYALALAYSLTTPIAIAIGLGVRNSYRDDSFEALVVSGVLDAMAAGIMLYTAMVELLARDFIFNPNRTKNIWELNLQLFCLLLGGGLMALLGKWA